MDHPNKFHQISLPIDTQELILQDQTLRGVCDVPCLRVRGEEHRPAGQGPVLCDVPVRPPLAQDAVS